MVFQKHPDHLKNHLDDLKKKAQKQVDFILKGIKTGIYMLAKTFRIKRIDSKISFIFLF